MILILSNKYDISVDYVVRLLRKNNTRFLRINTEDLINNTVAVSFPEFSYLIQTGASKYNLSRELRSVWFRRPGKPFEFSDKESQPNNLVTSFIEDQWHTFIEGIKSIENVLWINNPDKNYTAENKIFQLQFARKIGLLVPRTCITNDKEEVIEFMKQCDGKVVAKALYSPLIEGKNKDYFIFTNILDSIEDIHEREFNLSPTIFQELLTEKIDYRLTIIGDECFSVKVIRESGKGISTDWRIIKKGVRFIPCELPSDIVDRCVGMVKKLGLVFGAIDLVQSKDRFYFLEINPNGEWAWLQKEAKLPIAEKLIEHLTRGGKM